MNFKILALVAVAAVGISGAASAATMSLLGGTTLTFGTQAGSNYDADCSGGVSSCYNPNGAFAATLTETLSVFSAAPTGLNISDNATIRVTFLGKEAGATNTAFSMAGGSVSNLAEIGSSFTALVGGPGLLDFTFTSSLGTAAGSAGFVGTAAIAFSALFDGDRSVYAYFDDSGAANDRDWDDMVVRIDVVSVEVVPLPAAGLLLLGGLGAMVAMTRRRKAA